MAATQPALLALSNLLRNAAVDRALPLLRGLARAAADIVFPPACLNCRQSTGAMGSLCAACWAQVRYRASLLRASGHAFRHGSRQ